MLRIAAVLSFLLVLGACCPITATHPLSAPADAVYDARLTGAWCSAPNQKDTAFIHIGKGADNTLQVLGVEHHDDGKMVQENFPVFVSIVGQKHYLNIDLKKLHLEEAKGHEGYIFVQYDLLDSNTLVISYMDEALLANAIMEKKVAGRVTYEEPVDTPQGMPGDKKIQCVYLTADTASLREFIASDTAGKLFVPYMKLKRIRN